MILLIEILLGILIITTYLFAVFGIIFILLSAMYSDLKGAPYVPNDNNVISAALKLSCASKDSKLIDLGSGDGRALFIAVKDFGVKKAVGYEISPWPYFLSRFKAAKLGVKNCIEFYRESIFNADLSSQDIIYLYLLPGLLKKLSSKLIKAKKDNPNLKIVSPVFEIEGMIAKDKLRVYHAGFKKDVYIYLY